MKEKFKTFVKANPKLIDYVKNKKGSWQDLYEIYSLYGEDENIWEKYTNDDNSINDLIKLIKNVNLENIKNVIDGMQKAISLIQNISSNSNDNNDNYESKGKYNDLDD